jgi:hypothetical protein
MNRPFYKYLAPGYAISLGILIALMVLPLQWKFISVAAWLLCVEAVDRRRPWVPFRPVVVDRRSRWMTRIASATVDGDPTVAFERIQSALDLLGVRHVREQASAATIVGFMPGKRRSLGLEVSATVVSSGKQQSRILCRCRPRFALLFLDDGASEECLHAFLSAVSGDLSRE